MRGRRKQRAGPDDLISATEIACFAYCPEQWRLQYGLRLPPGNQSALVAGTRHHARKAGVERVAGGTIAIGRILAILAVLVLFVAWILTR
jgi:hypothetical protein